MTTSLLKLAIPTEGSLDGTWGDVVNNGITQYLDIAVAGTTTLLTDADVNLTSTEGDVSGTNIVGTSAQHAVLLCSDARTAQRNINTPKQSKTYVVINNTTGGFAVVVRGGPDTPTTGVSVAAGERVLIAWSGTDFVKVAPSTAGTVTSVGGTGTVNGITLTGTVTSSGNLTLGGALSNVSLSTQVTGTLPVANGGTGVTTSTGTGAVVLSNSPTLVTPALGTPASGTLTNTTGLPIDGGTTGTLPVNRGGTGATSLTANNVILGNGTSAVQVVAPGTSGNVLTSNGTTWVSGAASGGSLLGTTNSATPFLTALGFNAGAASGAGTVRNTFIGYEAGAANNTGDDNAALGYQAFTSNTSGFGSSAFGRAALAAATTASNNTAIGDRSLTTATTCINNTAIGARSAFSATTGGNNTAVGYSALFTNDTSASNTAIGYEALFACTGAQNTALGSNAGNNLVSGTNNTIIGFDADSSTTSISNEITLGNASISTLRCQVTSITSLSDLRDKTDVSPVQDALKLVNTLNPVRFTWNTRDGAKVGIPDMGFIAQELKAAQEQSGVAVPNLVYESNPDRMEAAYGTLIPVLVKAIQELSAEVAALKAKA